MDAARILIADDHPLFRAALAFGLRELFPRAQIFEAASFALLESAVAQNPEVDLVLLDLNMPGAKGLSALIYLRGERPATPGLGISANDTPRTVRHARSEEHTSELQSQSNLVCRLLLEKKKTKGK